MATHSSVLAWRIPGTEEPSGLPSMVSHRVGHDWSNLAAAAATISPFSHSVMSNFWWPHGLQHSMLPCQSPTPGACSNSCPPTQWCHRGISYSVIPFSSCLQSFPASFFSSESTRHIRWPKYWSFSFSSSNEYSGLISFRITGLFSLQSKGLSRVFSNTTV